MPRFETIHLYRMTHIQNIPHILRHGITHSSSPNANRHFVPIGDNSFILTRERRILECGRRLGEYIPFYFGTRMPMLYVIQRGYNGVNPTSGKDIVYCVSSVQKIIEANLDFQFTDGHAVDLLSSQYGREDIQRIGEIIDWNAIEAKFWKDENDLDLKRRKEAEFLVLGDIPPSSVLGYVVYDEAAKETLTKFGVSEGKIAVRPQYYF